MPDDEATTHQRWAYLRFSIVGGLLAAPPARGELEAELVRLAAKEWLHPVTGQPARFAVSTIQRWYYAARGEKQDPVGVLRRKIRTDTGGQPSLNVDLRRVLEAQYRAHRRWSYQLHVDNLDVRVQENPAFGADAVLLQRAALHEESRVDSPGAGAWEKMTPGQERAQARLEAREVRSFEAEHVFGLWHLDFHEGSHQIPTAEGPWLKPMLLAILDDHSRLVCHAQWYRSQTAEDLVHGLSQTFLKRGLPRSLMTDNGSAMIAAETRQGLQRLGIVHATTPYTLRESCPRMAPPGFTVVWRLM